MSQVLPGIPLKTRIRSEGLSCCLASCLDKGQPKAEQDRLPVHEVALWSYGAGSAAGSVSAFLQENKRDRERERETDRERGKVPDLRTSLHIYIYMYIYTHTQALNPIEP